MPCAMLLPLFLISPLVVDITFVAATGSLIWNMNKLLVNTIPAKAGEL